METIDNRELGILWQAVYGARAAILRGEQDTESRERARAYSNLLRKLATEQDKRSLAAHGTPQDPDVESISEGEHNV